MRRNFITGLVKMATSSSKKTFPSAFVFDLDGCIWAPEMYEMWGGSGAPFKLAKDKLDLVAKDGTKVELLADVRTLFRYKNRF